MGGNTCLLLDELFDGVARYADGTCAQVFNVELLHLVGLAPSLSHYHFTELPICTQEDAQGLCALRLVESPCAWLIAHR